MPVELGGDADLQESHAPLWETLLFYTVFYRSHSWALYLSFRPASVFPPLLHSRSIKSEIKNHRNITLGDRKTKTDLTTRQGSRPWPTREQSRLWSEAGRRRRRERTALCSDGRTGATSLSPVRPCGRAGQLTASEAVSETGTSSRCRSWRLGPAILTPGGSLSAGSLHGTEITTGEFPGEIF